MSYKIRYTEWHCGGDCYGEYSFVANGGYGARLLASFGQQWVEGGEKQYGGVGFGGGW